MVEPGGVENTDVWRKVALQYGLDYPVCKTVCNCSAK